LTEPKQVIDEYFRELNPLLDRPILDLNLEEQSLRLQASTQDLDTQPAPPSELHNRSTPKRVVHNEPELRNVLNDLIGVKGFASHMRILVKPLE
jgi:hypothetical protein